MNSRQICYLDNNGTTRTAPEVVEAMVPFFSEHWGNPSAFYSFGRRVGKELARAREKAAALLGAEPAEIIFTSGGTESNNSAIHSALMTHPNKRHVVITAVEHAAVLKYCASLRERGYQVTVLPVDASGALDLRLAEESIRPDTAIVSAMWANNETGVIFPVAEIAAICRGQGVLFHTDAVQAAGKLQLDVRGVGVDLLSLSAHKFHGPKGVGLLYVKRGTAYQACMIGGGQERGRRGGTENVPGIIGAGRAAELVMAQLGNGIARMSSLRDRLENRILEQIPGTVRNGAGNPRLPNTANISFAGVEAEGVLMLLDQAGICASSGSACTSGSLDPSHVLIAMGCSVARARASIRFSLGRDNTDADVEHVLAHLPQIISTLRANTARPGVLG